MTRPLHVATGRPVVLDSSIVFKWFDTTESGADIAAALLDAHATDDVAIVVPAHLPLEVLNVHASRGGSPDRMLAVIESLADADLLVAPVDDALLAASVRIAAEERLTLYDAAFIALAAYLDAELVTADRRQAATQSCRVRLVT